MQVGALLLLLAPSPHYRSGVPAFSKNDLYHKSSNSSRGLIFQDELLGGAYSRGGLVEGGLISKLLFSSKFNKEKRQKGYFIDEIY